MAPDSKIIEGNDIQQISGCEETVWQAAPTTIETASMDYLCERLIFLAEDMAPGRGKYEYLEIRTGISAARWQNLFLRRVTPSADMLLAVTMYRPESIEWLLFGRVNGEASTPQSAPIESRWNEFLAQQNYLEKKRIKKVIN